MTSGPLPASSSGCSFWAYVGPEGTYSNLTLMSGLAFSNAALTAATFAGSAPPPFQAWTLIVTVGPLGAAFDVAVAGADAGAGPDAVAAAEDPAAEVAAGAELLLALDV